MMVGGVLESNKKWDIGKEVIECISKVYPGVDPIHPEVLIMIVFFFFLQFILLARFIPRNFKFSTLAEQYDLYKCIYIVTGICICQS